MSCIQALAVVSAIVGVAVGLWASALGSSPLCPGPGQPLYERCPANISVTGAIPPSTFTLWECALFGVGAAMLMLLLAWVGARFLSASEAHNSHQASSGDLLT